MRVRVYRAIFTTGSSELTTSWPGEDPAIQHFRSDEMDHIASSVELPVQANDTGEPFDARPFPIETFRMRRLGSVVRWGLSGILLAALALFVAHQITPWPAALFFRVLFDYGGVQMADALAKHVPAGVAARIDEHYDASDPDARLDVFFPVAVENSGKALTTIVWIHGGGFLSGSKEQVANYARIYAAEGYVVASVNYSLAPSAKYPKPLHQVNAALAFLQKNAARFHIDPSRIVLAGDSAGAQLAAQTANIISVPDYAKAVGVLPAISRKQLIGVLLFCGIYDAKSVRPGGGVMGEFLRTVGRAYFGTENFASDPQVAQFSVTNHITAQFPSTFISAGNADPLLPHSLALADAIEKQGGKVERLFFPADHTPPLGHEYQFTLDTDAGKLALSRALNFLRSLP
jgi:acetyl esterase